MGYLVLINSRGLIQNYNIRIGKNNAGVNNIFLTIYTDVGVIRYRIWQDRRHPDLNLIYNDLINGLNRAKNSAGIVFEISEDPERMYIFVTYPDGRTEQYSAVRI